MGNRWSRRGLTFSFVFPCLVLLVVFALSMAFATPVHADSADQPPPPAVRSKPMNEVEVAATPQNLSLLATLDVAARSSDNAGYVLADVTAAQEAALAQKGIVYQVVRSFIQVEGEGSPPSLAVGSTTVERYPLIPFGYPHLVEDDNWISGVAADQRIVSVDVHVVITHSLVNNLYIRLYDPGREFAQLWDHGGWYMSNLDQWWYNLSNFNGWPVNGAWTLTVADTIPGDDDGLLYYWLLRVYYHPGAMVWGEDKIQRLIPDLGSVSSSLVITGAPAGSRITGIDTHVVISHPFISDLRILLRDTSSHEMTLWNHGGEYMSDLDRWWYDLDLWNGAPVNDTWTLEVDDEVALDHGTLRTWLIRIYYEVSPQAAGVAESPPECVMILAPPRFIDSCTLLPETPPHTYITGVDLRADVVGIAAVRLHSCNGGYVELASPGEAVGDRWWYGLSAWNGQPAQGCWYLSLLQRPEDPGISVLEYWLVRVYYEWRLLFPRVMAGAQ